MNIRLLTCFALSCIIFFSCRKDDYNPTPVVINPPPASKTYTADEITGFEQLALNTLKTGSATITKLPKHVYYYITDTSDAYFVKQVDKVLAEINALTDTNLVVERTNNSAAALAKIYFTDTTHLFAEVPGAYEFYHSYSYELSGLTLLDWDDNNIIYRDDIYINKDSSERDTSAMLELTHHELLHSLGMLGHTDIGHFGSVMYIYNVTPYVTDYAYFDKRMVQLFYNPAILPGMNQPQVEAVLANL